MTCGLGLVDLVLLTSFVNGRANLLSDCLNRLAEDTENEIEASRRVGSLVTENICPNFLKYNGVVTFPRDLGNGPEIYLGLLMEHCSKGDAESYLKANSLSEDEDKFLLQIQQIIFQATFALHAAKEERNLKHYDVKLLNVFLQSLPPTGQEHTVLRYGLENNVFALEMSTASGFIAKLGDFGNATIGSESVDIGVSVRQFKAIQNTPPEFLIRGDKAKQCHGHDTFGLGLCFLHLFMEDAPYEVILKKVGCPLPLKKMLQVIWSGPGYKAINDVITNNDGLDILSDTLYRFFVLFGTQDIEKLGGKEWAKIAASFGKTAMTTRSDSSVIDQFDKDQKLYSLETGTELVITRARDRLHAAAGGMDLLRRLVDFDPGNRPTYVEVLNSSYMCSLRECGHTDDTSPSSEPSKHVMSFMKYFTSTAEELPSTINSTNNTMVVENTRDGTTEASPTSSTISSIVQDKLKQILDEREQREAALDALEIKKAAPQQPLLQKTPPQLDPAEVEKKIMSPLDTYQISDGEDSNSGESNDGTKKKIPAWAQIENLIPALKKQYAGNADRLDPDLLFPEVETCDLEAIFDKKESRFNKRNSSGDWTKDRVTAPEKLTYKRTMDELRKNKMNG